MPRVYEPRCAKRVPMVLRCWCGCSVKSLLPPGPDVDEGWPLHRCRGGDVVAFPSSLAEQTTMKELRQ